MSHNKQLLALSIVMALGLSVISQQLFNMAIMGSVEKVTWKTFKDSAGLFSIQYPSKWEARNGTNPVTPIDVEFWYYGDASNMPDTDAMVALVVSPNSEFLTTQDMIKNDQLAIESSGVNFRLEQSTECNTYVINQVQGCSLISSLSFPEQKYGRNVLIVSAVDNSTGIQYSMILSASEDVFEQFKPVFDHMVNSFELNSSGMTLNDSLQITNGSSQYDSGRDMGCDEASSGLAESKTVGQLEGYTDEFVRGYYDGFAWCDPVESPDTQPPSSNTGGSTPTQPSQSSQSGASIDRGGGIIDKPFGEGSSTQSPASQGEGIDWIKTCNDLQTALVSSCDVLVNPDNILTREGERGVGCIRNGIALAGGGTLLLNLPLPLVVAALQILEEPTGCGGIVEWESIGNVDDLQGIINRLT